MFKPIYGQWGQNCNHKYSLRVNSELDYFYYEPNEETYMYIHLETKLSAET